MSAAKRVLVIDDHHHLASLAAGAGLTAPAPQAAFPQRLVFKV